MYDRLFTKDSGQNVWRCDTKQRASRVGQKNVEQIARNRGGNDVADVWQDWLKKLVPAVLVWGLVKEVQHETGGIMASRSSAKRFSVPFMTGSRLEGASVLACTSSLDRGPSVDW